MVRVFCLGLEIMVYGKGVWFMVYGIGVRFTTVSGLCLGFRVHGLWSRTKLNCRGFGFMVYDVWFNV